MTPRSTLAHYAQLVAADVSKVLSDMDAALAQQPLGMLGGPFLTALTRADQIAVQAVIGRPGEAGAWREAVRGAWQAAVANAAQQHTAGDAADTGLATQHATLRLTLKDEQEVEEEIELSRLMQQLESQAESSLRELRPLAATVAAEPGQAADVNTDAVLLHPQAAAAALGEAVRGLPLSAPARLAALHVLCLAAAAPLVEGYRRQVKALQALGVRPAQFRVRLSPDVRAARAPAVETDERQDRMAVVLNRLVQQAAAEWAQEERAQVERAQAERADVQRAATPVVPSAGGATTGVDWPRELADRLMDQLLRTLGQETQVAPAMRDVLRQLTSPGQRLAAREPALWQQHEHPWWQLLDRLMGLCAVLDDGPGAAQDTLAAGCTPLVTQFAETDVPDTAACQQLLVEVDTLARRLASGAPGSAADSTSPGDAEQAKPVPAAEPPLDQVLRDQMAQQLRQSQAPASLRRFLLGPWVQVLSHALDADRGDPARAQRYSHWVDGLLAVVARSQPATQAEMDKLLAVARTGLESIQLPEAQIESWLFDLTLRLSDQRAAEVPSEDGPGWRHEDLPTVPIDLPSGGVKAARARRDREAWLRSLRVGDICRAFLDAQWRTLQVAAVDERAQVYGLQERGAPEPYRLTRAALERLRAEGLATTVEPGAFIVRAMGDVVGSLGPQAPADTDAQSGA